MTILQISMAPGTVVSYDNALCIDGNWYSEVLSWIQKPLMACFHVLHVIIWCYVWCC